MSRPCFRRKINHAHVYEIVRQNATHVTLRSLIENALPRRTFEEDYEPVSAFDCLASTASPAGESVAVPREPTKAMLLAGFEESFVYISREIRERMVADIYRAMLAAAPLVPAQIERGPAEAGEAVAGPEGDATDAMIEAGLQVDADNEDERAYLHNVWHAMFYARPVEEPGEVERLTRERDAARRDYNELDKATEAALTAVLASKARLVEALRDAQAFVQEHYAPAIDREHALAQRIHAALAGDGKEATR